MLRTIATRSGRTLAALIGCLVVTGAALADDDDKRGGKRVISVDCNLPNASVQKQVDKLKHRRGGTIYIVGFCDESVSIVNDGVVLSGNGDGDGSIDGGLAEVIVTGAQRVEIEYLELTGAGYGLLVQEGGAAVISHSDIHDNEADGVGAYNNAFARVLYNRITGNGRAEYYEAGIEGGAGSVIRSIGNYIADNAYAAVEMGNMGYLRSGPFTPLGGEPPAPEDRDIILQKGCTRDQTADECRATAAPGTIAVDCFRGGICDFRHTDVVGESFISGLSNYDVRNTSINGNVGASGGSRLQLRSSVRGSGDVFCYTEAFASSFTQCGGSLPPP